MPRGRKKVDVVEEKKLAGKFNNDVLVAELQKTKENSHRFIDEAVKFFSDFIDEKYEKDDYSFKMDGGEWASWMEGKINVKGLHVGARRMMERVEHTICAARGFKSVFIRITTNDYEHFTCEITIHPVLPPNFSI